MVAALRNTVAGGKALPFAKRVEYIQSSGSQYINTGWLPKTTAILNLRCAIHSFSGNPQMGCIQNGGKPYYNWYWDANSRRLAYYFGNYAHEAGNYIFSANNSISLSVIQQIEYNGQSGTAKFNNTNLSGAPCNSVPTVPFYLFARNNRGSAELFCQASVYGFSVDLSGEKTLDLIPVIDLEGQAKMFDLVSGTYPAHYGTFTPGPEIGGV